MTNGNRGLVVVLAVLVVVVLMVSGLTGGMMGPGMMGRYGTGLVGAGGWGLAMGLGWLAMLAFWGALVAGVVLLVRWLGGTTGPGEARGGGESATDVLKRRYAAGELSREQYEEMRRTLERSAAA
jgi:putative membrane protein